MSPPDSSVPPASAYDDAEKGLAEEVLTPPRRSAAETDGPSSSSGSTVIHSPPLSPTTSAKQVVRLADAKTAEIEGRPAKSEEAAPTPKAPQPPKAEYPKFLQFVLWYNMYRRLFTIAMIFNVVTITITATGDFPYAHRHLGAFVLGNLTASILVRNEIFGRILYLLVNTLFAKVRR